METGLKALYLRMRHRATILRDEGGYDVNAGQCNPIIFQEFIGEVLDADLAPIIWEPFAGHTRHNLDYCEEIPGVQFMAQDIAPNDERVARGDSTKQGPSVRPCGMFFHPPYFGSNTFSAIEGELGMEGKLERYLAALSRTVSLANLCPQGLACVVGRVYRHDGKMIDLPLLFLQIFAQDGYKLIGMWSSEPDSILILRREIS